MAANSFGNIFRFSTFGESHGKALGVVIDGVPAGVPLDLGAIQAEMDRRKPGTGKLVSARKEADQAQFLSGLSPDGRTLGTPIAAQVLNADSKSGDYDDLRGKFRPGHADFTTWAKFGLRDHRGGGRASARETVGRVLAGAVAKQVLALQKISILGYVVEVGGLRADLAAISDKIGIADVEKSPVRCPDSKASAKMEALILEARDHSNSLGGVVEVQARGVPPGLGEPVFDKLSARIAAAFMSVPATRGVEIGAGFEAARMKGSDYPDVLDVREGRPFFQSNRHGGILGGISSGAAIVVRTAFKPTSTLPGQETELVTEEMKKAKVKMRGRHDPCVVPRAVPILEAMMACVLLDSLLEHRSRADFPGTDRGPWPLDKKTSAPKSEGVQFDQ